jgi:hypothetical protein
MGDGSVKVNPPDLLKYGMDLVFQMSTEQSNLAEPFEGIGQHAVGAFGNMATGTSQFAEGRTAMAINMRNLKDFQAFLKEVGTGLQAIQSAAMAIGVAYATTDDESALGLNAVDFAFAGTSGAPDGFPKKGMTTMSAEQAKADAESGRYSEAGQAADNPDMLQYATETETADGYRYTFSDGSVLVVTDAYNPGNFISSSSRTTSVYKPGDKQPSSVITTGESYDYSGQKTTSKTTQTLDADGKYVTSTSSTTQLSGGGVHVTNTTVGTDGKPQTTNTTVVPDKTPSPADSELTPTQQIENKYNAHGSTGGQGLHGGH